jgi:hypothetical protein
MTPRRIAVLASAFILSCASSHAAAPPATGYTPARAAEAGALPIHIGIVPERIRPQVAFQYVSVAGPAYTGNFPGMSTGQTIGANALGGAISSAIVNASLREQAENFARLAFANVSAGGCDLPYGERLAAQLTESVQAAWPQAQVQVHMLKPDQTIEDIVGKRTPRYEILASVSLATDFSALVASIDASTYAADGDDGRAERRPRWQNTLIAISDRVALAPKTQADIARMVADENARHEALELGQIIRRLNAEGVTEQNKAERRRVADAIARHKKALKEANRDKWTPQSEAMRRASLLSESDCAGMRTALDQVLGESRALLQAMTGGTLPEPLKVETVKRGAFLSVTQLVGETPGERAIVGLPDGSYVSRKGGEGVNTAFRYALLLDP